MGRIDGKTFVDRYTITLTDEAYQTLRQDFAVWAKDRCHAKPNPEKCDYYGEFNRVFRDGRVDRLETQALFYLLDDIKGNDQVVDSEEIKNSVFHNYRDRESGNIKDRKINILGHTFNYTSITSQTHPSDHFEGFPNARKELIGILKNSEQQLAELIEALEKQRWELGNSEASFWTFVSPENLYGLSARISFDDKTFSSMEHDGVQNLLSNLRKLHSGVLHFRRYYEIGYIATKGEEVQYFLHSFLADHINLDHFFDPLGMIETGEETDARNSKYAADMVDMAMSSGAQRFAYALASTLRSEVPNIDASQMYDYLPNTLFRFCDGTAQKTLNALAGIDSLGFLISGAILGKLLASSAKIVAAIGGLSDKTRFITFLIPGTTLLGRSAKPGFWNSAGIFAINGSLELIKATTYINLAYMIGGKETSTWIGRTYDLIIGMVSGYATGLLAKLGSTLERGDSTFAKFFFEKYGSTPSKLEIIAKEIARNTGNKTSRLTQPSNWKKFYSLLEKEVEAIETALRSAERATYLRGQSEKVIKELRKLVERNKGTISPETIRSNLNKIAKMTDPQKALKAYRRLLANTEATIGEARRAKLAPPTKTETTKKPIRRQVIKKGNGKKRVKAPEPETKNSKTQQLTRKTIKDPFDPFIKEPPTTLSIEEVQKLSKGVITADTSALKALQTFYEKNPKLRGSIWRRLKELSQNSITQNNNWTPLQAGSKKFRAKVGSDARLLVQRNPDGKYNITRIKYRGHIRTRDW